MRVPVEVFYVGDLTVQIVRDDYASNPEDNSDAPVYLAHFHRHLLRCSKDLPFSSRAEFGEWYDALLAEGSDKWGVFEVESYIHSGIVLALRGSDSWPDRQWDVSRCGFVLINKDEWEQACGLPAWTEPFDDEARAVRLAEYWEEVAEGHLREWNQYLSGDVYGYVIIRAETCDLGHTHEKEVDSCWGIYGLDFAGEAAKEAAESLRARTAPEGVP